MVVSPSADGSTSSIRVPFLREGENRGEVRGANGLVRLNDPGGERVRRFRSSFAAVKKRGMSLGYINQRQENRHVRNP